MNLQEVSEEDVCYEDINDLLLLSPNPGGDVYENAHGSQRLILEELGLKDAKFNIMKISPDIYDIKKRSIVGKIEYGCILTENGFYNPDEGNSNLENSIARGDDTIGLLFVSSDKKLVNYHPNPEYK